MFYLGAISMFSDGPSLITYLPLTIQAYMELSHWAKPKLDRNPNGFPIRYFKDHIIKGVQHQAQLLEIKHDIEIYIGIYQVVAILIGWTYFLQVIVYWQFLRIKYAINYNTKSAFTRVDEKINRVLSNSAVPSIFRTLYAKIKSGLAYLTSIDDPNN